MMDDLISRQAAIDAIKNQTCLTYEEIFNRCLTNIRDENGWVGGIKDAIEAVTGLPSIQPEIIACGDCKHWICHDRRCGYWNHGVKPLDWCCHAERRTDET